MKKKDSNTTEVKRYLLKLQDKISSNIKNIDSSTSIQIDDWRREEGGGGQSRIFKNGEIFEQAGVNFSHVSGSKLPETATKLRPELMDSNYEAMGLSLVMHPENPFIPTTHANLRYFSAENKKGNTVWWFGGGFDLTPYYGNDEDCQFWHQKAKDACDPFGEDIYPHFKNWCDEYFHLKHRDEPRGVGGLFFDDLNEYGFDTSFALMQSIGNAYIDAYAPIIERNKDREYGERQRDFQLHRRGRYVEFNLVYDRGTLFGLQSGGRTESILMSLPPEVRWGYDWKPEPDSEEAILYDRYLKPRDWLNI